jgi:hypothetical protein
LAKSLDCVSSHQFRDEVVKLPEPAACCVPCAADAAAAQAAANVSFSYNAASFLILRIGLLARHPVEARELVALEAGVQKVSTSRC